jgi:hypothetical protein
MKKLLLTLITLAAIHAQAGVVTGTITVPANTTNAVSDYIDIGDRAQVVRQIESVEFYVTQADTNKTTTVTLRQELGTALTNAITTATYTASGASLLWPMRTVTSLGVSGAYTNVVQYTAPYAVNRAFIAYNFAAATNSAVPVACSTNVSIRYNILTR